MHETLDLWIKGLGAFVAACAAIAAVITYRRNALTKRAEFVMSLHRSFFVEPTYKPMRDLLDSDDEAALKRAVDKESYEFTDFLNFFELMAYLSESGILECEDVEALIGYYLDRLKEKKAVYGYIRHADHGFEYLVRFLAKRTHR